MANHLKRDLLNKIAADKKASMDPEWFKNLAKLKALETQSSFSNTDMLFLLTQFKTSKLYRNIEVATLSEEATRNCIAKFDQKANPGEWANTFTTPNDNDIYAASLGIVSIAGLNNSTEGDDKKEVYVFADEHGKLSYIMHHSHIYYDMAVLNDLNRPE